MKREYDEIIKNKIGEENKNNTEQEVYLNQKQIEIEKVKEINKEKKKRRKK